MRNLLRGYKTLLILITAGSGCSVITTRGDLPTVSTYPLSKLKPKKVALRIFHIEENQRIESTMPPTGLSFFPDPEIQEIFSDEFRRSDYFSKVSLVSASLLPSSKKSSDRKSFINTLKQSTLIESLTELIVNITWRSDHGYHGLVGVLSTVWYAASFFSAGIIPSNSPYQVFMDVEVDDAQGKVLETFTVTNSANRWASTLFYLFHGSKPLWNKPTEGDGFYRNCAAAILMNLAKSKIL